MSHLPLNVFCVADFLFFFLKFHIKRSDNLSNCLLIVQEVPCCSCSADSLSGFSETEALLYFHFAGTVAYASDLIRPRSEGANKASCGRLLQLHLLTSPLWTTCGTPPPHIHPLPAIKALNCNTKAARRLWFVPPCQ